MNGRYGYAGDVTKNIGDLFNIVSKVRIFKLDDVEKNNSQRR